MIVKATTIRQVPKAFSVCQLIVPGDIYESRKLIKPVSKLSGSLRVGKVKTESVGNKCPCNVSGEVARSRFITRSESRELRD